MRVSGVMALSWTRIKCAQLVWLPVCFHHFKPFLIDSQGASLFHAQQEGERTLLKGV